MVEKEKKFKFNAAFYSEVDLHMHDDLEQMSKSLQSLIQHGDMSEEELKAYDGTDPRKPVLMAIKGKIYDVSSSRMFYGAGGTYGEWSGKDASRAIAKLSFEEEDLNCDLTGMGDDELDALDDWEIMFKSKYVKVGSIKNPERKSRGDMTEEELKSYDGRDPSKPILMAINGVIYDVSTERRLYGPGGPYELWTGKDCCRAVAKRSFKEEDLNSDLTGLGDHELQSLKNWEDTFRIKYVRVGVIAKCKVRKISVITHQGRPFCNLKDLRPQSNKW
ncbi:hypothetical protein L1887_19578 [Cichorium endivia]|nr:hypothetical protein L1887_19578 [Cichorium endivia]